MKIDSVDTYDTYKGEYTMTGYHRIALRWYGSCMTASDMLIVCQMIQARFGESNTCFSMENNHLVLELDVEYTGEWNTSLADFCSALKTVSNIVSWELLED